MNSIQQASKTSDVSMAPYIAMFIGSSMAINILIQIVLELFSTSTNHSATGIGSAVAAAAITAYRFAHVHQRVYSDNERKQLTRGATITLNIIATILLVAMYCLVKMVHEVPMIYLVILWALVLLVQYAICRTFFGKFSTRVIENYLAQKQKAKLAQ